MLPPRGEIDQLQAAPLRGCRFKGKRDAHETRTHTHTHVLSCCKTEVSNIRSGSREWPGNGSSLVHWRM